MPVEFLTVPVMDRRTESGDRGQGGSAPWRRSAPGADWHEAQRGCQYLSEDGLSRSSAPQHIWRLPTVQEAVRSVARRGQNSANVWDAETARASYQTTPDKESPLWNVRSQVIYWWTATEVDDERADFIVYDGRVWPRAKDFGPAYLGLRCVK